MKIVDIRGRTFPISSPFRNAYIDFSRMTLSLVAVITDVVRDGRTVVGFGFNSNGRYGQGSMMPERFIPRILEADLFQPFGGFPDGVRVQNGYVIMPELPGIGFEHKSDLYALTRELAA